MRAIKIIKNSFGDDKIKLYDGTQALIYVRADLYYDALDKPAETICMQDNEDNDYEFSLFSHWKESEDKDPHGPSIKHFQD